MVPKHESQTKWNAKYLGFVELAQLIASSRGKELAPIAPRQLIGASSRIFYLLLGGFSYLGTRQFDIRDGSSL